jgi:hypothetical protein
MHILSFFSGQIWSAIGAVVRAETASKHIEHHPSLALIFLIVVTQIDVLNKKNLTVIGG